MSYKKSIFEGVPRKNVNKSRFNLSHEYKGQMLPGYLTPCLLLETLPGDEWTIDSEFMFRFQPLFFPIMHKMTMRCDYFYVPNRILWMSNGGAEVGWQNWIMNFEDTAPPTFTANLSHNDLAFSVNVLAHMGLPLIDDDEAGASTLVENLNAFPPSAYLKIWDEYYRIPQLEEERWIALTSGDNTASLESGFNVAAGSVLPTLPAKWEMDYFTSALPTPQIGDAIKIPLIEESLLVPGSLNGPRQLREVGTGDIPVGSGGVNQDQGALELGGSGDDMYLDIDETAATIKQLRIAEVLQSYYERIMKVGQRYRDFIKGLWGNDPEPGVVDVPVLMGSKFGRIQIADVMTQANTAIGETGTSRTGDYTGQANMYATDNDTIRHYCAEHGWIIAIIQVNPNTSYGQGIERFWRRNVPTDYALDMFSSIGDQEILKEEVLYNPLTAEEEKNFETFGYIPRFSEYRFKNNIHVHNLNFNTGVSMHLGRIWPQTVRGATYDSTIEINSNFTESDPFSIGGTRITDTFRVLPVGESSIQYPGEGVMFTHIFHSIFVNRNLPMFSTPKL